jgi:peptidoglycan-associated lipoprotein
MKRRTIHATRNLGYPLALIALLILGFTLSACGGKDEAVQTNPAGSGMSSDDGVDNVDLKEGAFEGNEMQGEGAESSDLQAPSEETAPAIVLEDVFFDFDKYELSDEARATLNQDGRLLREKKDVRILIEGHCDERGTVQYNLALGEKRAKEAKAYLVDLGIAPTRIDIVSYGKERPFAMGHDEAAWKQNRRAHLVVR